MAINKSSRSLFLLVLIGTIEVHSCFSICSTLALELHTFRWGLLLLGCCDYSYKLYIRDSSPFCYINCYIWWTSSSSSLVFYSTKPWLSSDIYFIVCSDPSLIYPIFMSFLAFLLSLFLLFLLFLFLLIVTFLWANSPNLSYSSTSKSISFDFYFLFGFIFDSLLLFDTFLFLLYWDYLLFLLSLLFFIAFCGYDSFQFLKW